RATAESAFRLLWQRLKPPEREAWLLAAQLPPAWFSTELAEAIGLDAERRRSLVRLHVLDRDDEHGRHRMHRLLREVALHEDSPGSMTETVIRGASDFLETGDAALAFQRYRRDSESFVHLIAEAASVPGGSRFMTACARALRQLGDLPAARPLLEQALA